MKPTVNDRKNLVNDDYSLIQDFIRRPSRNILRGAPSPTTAIQISLKKPAKRTFIVFRQETDFQGKSIPGGGTSNGECAALPSCSFNTRHQDKANNKILFSTRQSLH